MNKVVPANKYVYQGIHFVIEEPGKENGLSPYSYVSRLGTVIEEESRDGRSDLNSTRNIELDSSFMVRNGKFVKQAQYLRKVTSVSEPSDLSVSNISTKDRAAENSPLTVESRSDRLSNKKF